MELTEVPREKENWVSKMGVLVSCDQIVKPLGSRLDWKNERYTENR